MADKRQARASSSDDGEAPLWRIALKRGGRRLARLEGRLQRASWSVASSGVVVFCLLSVFSCVGPKTAQTKETPVVRNLPSDEPWIRVLIVENAERATLAIDGLCTVVTADPKTGEATHHAPTATLDGLADTTVRIDGAGVVFEGQARYSGAIVLRPKNSGAFKVNGKTYPGELALRPTEKGLRIVNLLPLEDYLTGVIGKEMPLGFPEAALDAQAVAARSYALWQIQRAAKGRDHDVKNDTRSQVYGGASENPKARAVIERTRGQIATVGGKPFETFFHSTCGGQTVPAHWIFGGKPLAGLSGADCGRCVSSKYFRWEKTMTEAEVVEGLRRRGISLVTPIDRVRLESWDRGGYQKNVRIFHDGGMTQVSAAKFRSALRLRSTSFDLEIKGDKWEIKGRGWGHGVGLCQVGAKGFANEGMTGPMIIEHFYPGAVIEKLY